MPTTCRRCKRSFEPAGLGWFGSYLILELTFLVLITGALASGSLAGAVFGLSLAGLALWALWRNEQARDASVCPACEAERSGKD